MFEMRISDVNAESGGREAESLPGGTTQGVESEAVKQMRE